MVIIGFLSTEYSAFESGGPINFEFGVIEGELGFDVDLIFTTSDDTAIGKSKFLYGSAKLDTDETSHSTNLAANYSGGSTGGVVFGLKWPPFAIEKWVWFS